jgi:hypothetical protein
VAKMCDATFRVAKVRLTPQSPRRITGTCRVCNQPAGAIVITRPAGGTGIGRARMNYHEWPELARPIANRPQTASLPHMEVARG